MVFDDQFYRFVSTPATYDDAVADCADDSPTLKNTVLVAVRTADELLAMTMLHGTLVEFFHSSH